MKSIILAFLVAVIVFSTGGCNQHKKKTSLEITASDILGRSDYLAISYGGYRENTRTIVPDIAQLKEDMKILSAMGIKILRTYNTQQYSHTSNLLKAISELKAEDPDFEMYVMLGTWIECEGAWTDKINHRAGNVENNTAEIEAAIEMANTYPDIVKIIAVGNEAMVQWAVKYFVYPNVINKWVQHLKNWRDKGEIPSGVWITSSDNYESWGGGANNYKTEDLVELLKNVDFVSVHTYPFHDSHYNPSFWVVPEEEEKLSEMEQIDRAMLRAKNYAVSQYQAVADYMKEVGIEKPIHMGETGWASIAGTSYGASGSKAADEYKEKIFYEHMRDWTNSAGMSCFYFEAFDEKWKDAKNPMGSENHFGLINLKGQAKYALWEMVDAGIFEGLKRDGSPITKTYGGDEAKMFQDVLPPPLLSEMGFFEINTINQNRTAGELVTENNYIIVHHTLSPEEGDQITYPSEILKLNAWEGSCSLELSKDRIIQINTGTGPWWGCALEIQGGIGENLSGFESGSLNFDIRGNTNCTFQLGYQTGIFAMGNQTNNAIVFEPTKGNYQLTADWESYSIKLADFDNGAHLKDVSAPIFLRGFGNNDGEIIQLRNIYYSKE